jgi:hypothetical protein
VSHPRNAATGAPAGVQQFTFLSVGSQRDSKLRCLTQPNCADLNRLLNTAKAASVAMALEEKFQQSAAKPGMVRVSSDTLTGKQLLHIIQTGVIQKGEYELMPLEDGTSSILIDSTILDEMRITMTRELDDLKTMGDLKDLGNLFVHGEQIVSPDAECNARWTVSLTLGIFFFYSTVIQGDQVRDKWFTSFGEQ